MANALNESRAQMCWETFLRRWKHWCTGPTLTVPFGHLPLIWFICAYLHVSCDQLEPVEMWASFSKLQSPKWNLNWNWWKELKGLNESTWASSQQANCSWLGVASGCAPGSLPCLKRFGLKRIKVIHQNVATNFQAISNPLSSEALMHSTNSCLSRAKLSCVACLKAKAPSYAMLTTKAKISKPASTANGYIGNWKTGWNCVAVLNRRCPGFKIFQKCSKWLSVL